MVVHKMREFQALHDFVAEAPNVCRACQRPSWPQRPTWSRRITGHGEEIRRQIQHLGAHLIDEEALPGKIASVDKSLFRSLGPLWHKSYRDKGLIPDKLRNVDPEATWGYSPYHGGVQGYGLHAVCSSDPDTPMVFLEAWVETASVHEARVFPRFVPPLSDSIDRLVADTRYNGEELLASLEQRAGDRITRRLVVPRQNTASTSPQPTAYAAYDHSPWGRHFYQLRKIIIEPLFGRFKLLFHLKERVWMKGLANVRALLLTAI